jgi:hypothetical protein
MNRSIRFIVAAIFLIGALALAQGQIAWAGGSLGQVLNGALGSPAAAPNVAPALPGTVNPPPVVVGIAAPGTFAVGGVCTFHVIRMDPGYSISADLLPFASLGTQPDTIQNYLAGVCRAIYTEAGKGTIDSLGTHGEVQICFASVPDTNGVNYLYNPWQTLTGPASGETYTALTTTADGSLLCAPAQDTGKYFLANAKQ